MIYRDRFALNNRILDKLTLGATALATVGTAVVTSSSTAAAVVAATVVVVSASTPSYIYAI